MVYSKYRQQLNFLGPTAIRFWQAKDLLSASEGTSNLNVYNEIVRMIINENQVLQKLMIELLVSENIISSVEEFNTLQPRKANPRRSRNIDKASYLSLRRSDEGLVTEQYSKNADMKSVEHRTSRDIISPILMPNNLSVADLF
jgi:hypothetical protein